MTSPLTESDSKGCCATAVRWVVLETRVLFRVPNIVRRPHKKGLRIRESPMWLLGHVMGQRPENMQTTTVELRL